MEEYEWNDYGDMLDTPMENEEKNDITQRNPTLKILRWMCVKE